MKPFVAVIGMQRSGTNYLRRALCSSGKFFDLDEIFQGEDRPGGFDGTFWDFKSRRVRNDPTLSIPTQRAQETLLKQFFDEQREGLALSAPDAKAYLFDVKYNSLHCMDGIWRTPGEAPYFLHLIKKLGIPCLHVTRENMLDIAISLEIANRTGQWVIEKGEQAKPVSPFRIDPEYLVNVLIGFETAVALVNKWLVGLNIKRIEVPYEEIAASKNQFPVHLSTKIASICQIDGEFSPEVATQKVVKDRSSLILNMDSELVPALRKSGFSKYLDHG